MGKKSKSAVIALLLLLFIIPAAAATTISIGGVFVEPGETSATQVMIEDVTHVGTVDITIVYDQYMLPVPQTANLILCIRSSTIQQVLSGSAGWLMVMG
jgi:hypothetical protein